MSLHQLSATQIVKGLKSGELTAHQVTQSQLDRINRLNPEINAIVATNEKPDNDMFGSLAGLPITLKDQIHLKGMTCTFGSEQHKDFRPTRTAPVVERLLSAGAHVIGRTNLPPFAMDFQCSNPLFGTTNNPWNIDYTTGGSSGGGAAAVAAGLSFLDIGTDLSGSLRIPASFCGVFSLLPTENALPNDGMMANGAAPLRHFARMGPIARTPEDLDLAWAHMSEPTGEAEKEFVMPDAFWSVDSAGIEVCDGIRQCFENAAKEWRKSGFQVSQGQPKHFDFSRARRAFGEIMGFETGELIPASVRFLARLFGRSSARRSPAFIANVMLGYRHNQKRYDDALAEKAVLSEAVDAFLGENGIWLLPVTAVSAFKHMAPTSDRSGIRDYANPLFINGQPVNYFDAMTSFVTPISLTGHPVVTLPLGQDKNGLPIGAQLIGKKGQERHLIQTAKFLYDVLKKADCPMFTRA
ncbi:amidase [Pseudophaeobacter sp. EL27]|uniref:amidase n=1 Tax=Pseudophaeobacter sp. EL27 TaxID=2107580 RepID=UPI000EFC0FC8|nr:amidase [Pseudophaeobacter sp. EL27]